MNDYEAVLKSMNDVKPIDLLPDIGAMPMKSVAEYFDVSIGLLYTDPVYLNRDSDPGFIFITPDMLTAVGL